MIQERDAHQHVPASTPEVCSPVLYYSENQQAEGPMLKATIDIATSIAHDLNVSREIVWEIIKGMRYGSIEELEIKVSKALVGGHVSAS